jgi:hypothetical protein
VCSSDLIFIELAPILLTARPENEHLVQEKGRVTLLPVAEVSDTLCFGGSFFSDYNISETMIAAAENGELERLRLWFQAVLIEARYGPDRKRDIEKIKVMYQYAGVCIDLLHEPKLKRAWFDAIQKHSDEFSMRSVWSAFFKGAGMHLKQRLGLQMKQWLDSDDFFIKLSLGETLADYADLKESSSYLSTLIQDSQSPWVALRACDAILTGTQRWDCDRLDIAREFTVLAWQLMQGRKDVDNPRFLDQITEAAVESQCTQVLKNISEFVAENTPCAASLCRVAIDTYLGMFQDEHRPKKENTPGRQTQAIQEFFQLDGITQLFTELIKQSGGASSDDSEEIIRYQHGWRNTGLQSGLGWIIALIDGICDTEERRDGLTWMAGWIGQVNPEHDQRWKVAERISKLAVEMRSEERRVGKECRRLCRSRWSPYH